jgi:His-Xaa-Ser system radical SAM maturase HxsC
MDAIKDKLLRKDRFKIISPTIPFGLYKLISGEHESSIILPIHFIYSDRESDSIEISIGQDNVYVLSLPLSARYLEKGDIIQVNKHSIRVVLSKNADTNTLLVTEQCNNLCSFCSQPPKEADDSYLYDQAIAALIEFNFSGQIGITGGEPTLNKKKFIELISKPSLYDNETNLHILTNGRSFSDIEFCKEIKNSTDSNNIVFGVPLYSHNPTTHDKLVGAKGAWKETIDGLINAIHAGFRIELRFIPTQANYKELSRYLNFVSIFLYGIEQVSIMNLEPQGWAKNNWDELFVSPEMYIKTSIDALNLSEIKGVPVRLFNYPLCSLDSPKLEKYAVKSISDWKNYYPDECQKCIKKDLCGGYFISAQNNYLIRPRPYYGK